MVFNLNNPNARFNEQIKNVLFWDQNSKFNKPIDK